MHGDDRAQLIRNINHANFVVIVEKIILTEISVNELALLIQNSHVLYDLQIQLGVFLYIIKV
jgi:hypothetical protein